MAVVLVVVVASSIRSAVLMAPGGRIIIPTPFAASAGSWSSCFFRPLIFSKTKKIILLLIIKWKHEFIKAGWKCIVALPDASTARPVKVVCIFVVELITGAILKNRSKN